LLAKYQVLVAQKQTKSHEMSTVNGKDVHLFRQQWSEIVAEAVTCLQVAICEPVEVDDNGDIFGRQRINGTDPCIARTYCMTRV